jgi:hypothetical protein
VFTAQYELNLHIHFSSTNCSTSCKPLPQFCTQRSFLFKTANQKRTARLYHSNILTSSSHFGTKNQLQCRTALDSAQFQFSISVTAILDALSLFPVFHSRPSPLCFMLCASDAVVTFQTSGCHVISLYLTS